MSCPPDTTCIPCQTLAPCVATVCPPVNYTDTICDVSYPFRCSYWSGVSVPCLNIATGDTGDVIISKLMLAICNNTFTSANDKFKISATDTTQDFFFNKIIAGTNIVFTKANPGANENITISATFTQTPLVITSSANTITSVLTGVSNHTANLNVNVSTDIGNILVVHTNGLYTASTSKLKISTTDTTEDYLISKLIAGSNISIVKLNPGANEQYQISSVAGGIANIMSTNTATITVTGSGTSIAPLVINSNISTNVNNILTSDSTGLLVLPTYNYLVKTSSGDIQAGYLQDKLIAGTGITIVKQNIGAIETLLISGTFTTNVIQSSSLTIALSGNGTVGTPLSADVIISSTANNILTNSFGLYVSKTFVTAGSNISVTGFGTSLTPYIIASTYNYVLPVATSGQLGGIKVGAGLTIAIDGTLSTTGAGGIIPIANGGTGSATQNFVDLTTDQNNINGVKTFIGTSLQVTNLLLVGSTATNSKISALNTLLFSAIEGITTRDLTNTISINNGISGQNYITNSALFTHTSLKNVVGGSGVLYFNNTANIVLYTDPKTAYSGLNGVVYGGNSGNVSGDFINGISSNAYFSNTANYTNIAGIKLSNPGVNTTLGSYTGIITNYYSVYIPDIASSDVAGNITNKYGIYQAGTTAQNYFGGTSTFASGGFDSDMRLKTLIEVAPIVKDIQNLKSKSYTKDGQFHIGYFAQEVELIVPSAIIKKADGFLSVAYHEVHTAKIEYLESKIQELENLLKNK